MHCWIMNRWIVYCELAQPMMTSQILKCVDFTKTLKSRYLENKTFFLQIKNSLITYQGLLYGKYCFVGEVTFKYLLLRVRF